MGCTAKRRVRAFLRAPLFDMQPVMHPATFGQWHVRGDTLVCRLPRKTVTVQAPSALLRQVMALCDGRLGWKEVAAELARRWAPPDVDGFLAHLKGEGLLVDASELLPRWMDLGQAPGVFAPPAPRDEWAALPLHAEGRLLTAKGPDDRMPHAARSFASLLGERASQRTFADRPLAAAALRAILWAAGGV
ncbi:MAG: hypothetical protein AVDCRST_MAG51-3252, partial [uncultured Ramlibacter sp.]